MKRSMQAAVDLVRCQCFCTMGLNTLTITEFQYMNIQVLLRYVHMCSLFEEYIFLCICMLWRCSVSTLQICQHTGPMVDPDKRDVDPGCPSIPNVAAFIQNTFKGIELKPSIVEHCLYTVGDTHCILVSSTSLTVTSSLEIL